VAPVATSPAGTILVVRTPPSDEKDLRVLMLQRRPDMRFMGGYWVFPGGAVDAHETHAAADAISAAAVAACRELREEAGLDLEPGALTRVAHWITPSAMSRRFDTHFFLARAPAGQEPRLDQAEANAMCWVRPADQAYTCQPNTEFPITAPTQMVLRELAQDLEDARTLEQLLERAAQRPIVTVLPKIQGEDVVLPWDPQYRHIEGESLEWDDALMATRAGWPTRMPVHVAHPGPKPR
jgi:8-oxo-dGTP pyrophosphatase MutT (NUDIX family)